MPTLLNARSRGFVNTPTIERLTTRALRYLQSGFSVHLRGPAGTGKTTIALHLADLLSRPIMLIFGDDELKTSDLIGNQSGYTRKKVVDNYIHSVIKLEDELRKNWVDSRLTLAAKEGFTLVYDEFNRSRPEVNNVLLSTLEEKLLVLPPNNSRSEYIRVHPQFRAIFTSNPEEYCGVHATQDALLDRLVTLNMPDPEAETQTAILVEKIGITPEEAQTIVDIVMEFQQKTGTQKTLGLRSGLMIAKICHEHQIAIALNQEAFREVCEDILLSRTDLDLSAAHLVLNTLFDPEIAPPPTVTAPQPPQPAQQVYSFLHQSQGAKLSDIESAVGLNRIETVNILRHLMEQGKIRLNEERKYIAQ
ncbi:gas vesicle protein GvpN [Roseofilum sp. BLCC_M154]|uniref:Gas vesicle protein GvpN n=1 Tax=Roseofilum acuticapitatum BLCC-M154 TaxID=3022444 RepID=A0ABT7AR53_9CYAN|nr:gas vesicle protein GvpN [Roseofilum acuticapitatum]MDJ1169355.1 gas vesicle protein GvpN [Roseofilum acuticapitatum BLCC-M154]